MEHSPVAMAASVALSKWPWFARPVVAEFLPEMRELRRRFNKLASFIEPLHKVSFGDGALLSNHWLKVSFSETL